MGTMVLITPDGSESYHEAKKLDIHKVYELIGCNIVERVKVRYDGKIRDCYLDEEGLYRQGQSNPRVRQLAEAYYGRPCQTFMGAGVVWIP